MAAANGLTVVRTRGLAALAVLCAATALVPMVVTATWLLQLSMVLIVGVLANILVTLVSRAGFGSLAGLFASFVSIGAIYAPTESLAGVLPTPASVTALAELLNAGSATIWALEAPLPAAAGLQALMVTGLTLAWWCTDALVGATQSPALAGVPMLAIVLPAAALSDGGVTAWSFALAAAGYLAVMLGSEALRAREWGQLVPGRSRPSWGLDGIVVTAVAVMVALFVPTLVPQLGTRLVPTREDGATIAVLNPMIDLHDNLVSQGNAVVLRYETTAPQPEPLRVVADDDFDGRRWQPTYGTLNRGDRVERGLPRAPGLGPDVPTVPTTTTVTIEALRQTWLPTPYPATRIEVAEDGEWLYDRSTLSVVGDGRTKRGLRYTVSHDLVTPTPEQLQATGPTTEAEQWTALPPDTPSSIQATAMQVAGTGSHYDQALRLQAWLRSSGEFSYSENAPPETGSGAIIDFLTRRSGYCVHFASTMAVMARSLGIPARVAVGFQPGRRQADGSYEVRQRDAHAWPELYFSGLGWLRFEPTPAIQVASVPPWAVTDSPDTPVATPTPEPTATTATPTVAPTPAAEPAQGLGDRLLAVLRAISWRWLVVIGLVAVVLAAPWTTARAIRRARWRSARSPVEAAEAAWAELLDDLDDLGIRLSAAATVREVTATIEQLLETATPADARHAHRTDGDQADARPTDALTRLARLTDDVEAARYAPLSVDAARQASLKADAGHAPRQVAPRQADGSAAVGLAQRPATELADRRSDVRAVVAAVRVVRMPSLRQRLLPRTGLRALRQRRDRLLSWLARM